MLRHIASLAVLGLLATLNVVLAVPMLGTPELDARAPSVSKDGGHHNWTVPGMVEFDATCDSHNSDV